MRGKKKRVNGARRCQSDEVISKGGNLPGEFGELGGLPGHEDRGARTLLGEPVAPTSPKVCRR